MRHILPGRLAFLVVSLITIVILSPFLMGNILGQSIIYLLAVAACVATVYGLKLGLWPRVTTLFLAILSVAIGVASFYAKGPVVQSISFLSATLFYGFLTALLIRYIVRAEKVTADILFGSVSVYLLIGIVFAMVFRLIDALNPAAFAFPVEDQVAGVQGHADFTYFSFVTLTTLGYGDIQPLSGYARTFAFLEAITGTLYVAILISRLVSLYITDSVMAKSKTS